MMTLPPTEQPETELMKPLEDEEVTGNEAGWKKRYFQSKNGDSWKMNESLQGQVVKKKKDDIDLWTGM